MSVNDSKIKSYCLFPQSFSSVKIQIFLFCNDFRHVFDIANLKIICQFHAHSVHQNSVEIYWAEIYRGRLYLRAEIYRGRFLTLITGSSSRLLRIRFSADLTMYWFPVYHFRCMKFKPLVIWIWNQNIAISTIVGTSSHISVNTFQI